MGSLTGADFGLGLLTAPADTSSDPSMFLISGFGGGVVCCCCAMVIPTASVLSFEGTGIGLVGWLLGRTTTRVPSEEVFGTLGGGPLGFVSTGVDERNSA